MAMVVEVIVTRAVVKMVAMQRCCMVKMMTTVLLCRGRVEDDAETEEKVGREEDREKAERVGILIHCWGRSVPVDEDRVDQHR